jgi:hypothetical protein
MTERKCSVDDCQRPYRSRGLCSSHYNRMMRAGEIAVVQPQRPDDERFWANVDASGVCWEWTGALHPSGYGYFSAKRRKSHRAHRYAWALLVGEIPQAMTIDHVCRNKRCVNPDHFELVTAEENTRRSGSASAINARKTKCKRGHEFTPENTYVQYNKGKAGRLCRTCVRTYQAARRNGIPLPAWW